MLQVVASSLRPLACSLLLYSGISFKSQLLYTIVFCTRYLDIFGESSLYRTLMKLFFIGSSVYVLYLMRVKYR
jgi:ER lumen protein retaining receptor